MNAVVSGVAVLAFTAEELAQIAQAYMTVSQLVEKIRTSSPYAWQAVTADFQQAALDWERSGAPTFPVQTPVDPGSSAPTVPAQTGEPPQLQGGEPPQLQGGEPPQLQGGEPPQLQGGEPPQLQGGEPPKLQGGEPPQLQGGEPPQLQGGEPAKSQAPAAGYPGADALPAGQHVQAITEKPTA